MRRTPAVQARYGGAVVDKAAEMAGRVLYDTRNDFPNLEVVVAFPTRDAHMEDMDDNDTMETFTGTATTTHHRRVWSVDETAEQLGISRAHAYELIARREIPHLRLGRRIVVPVHALDELLDRAVNTTR